MPPKFRVGIILIFATGSNRPAFETGFKGELPRKSTRGHRNRELQVSDAIGKVLVSRLLDFSSEKSQLYKNRHKKGPSFWCLSFSSESSRTA